MENILNNKTYEVYCTTNTDKLKLLELLNNLTGWRWGSGRKPTEYEGYPTPMYLYLYCKDKEIYQSDHKSDDTSLIKLSAQKMIAKLNGEEYEEETFICEECGAVYDEEDLIYFDGKYWCNDCLERETFTCNCCGNREYYENEYGSADGSICEYCYENYYRVCDDCGALVHEDDIYWDDDGDYCYCERCWENRRNKAIHNYNYKPMPIFYGKNPLYMGIELEIDKGGECSDNAEILLDLMNADGEKIYCKHDGSICNGFEIVSHPANLEEHENNFKWAELMEKAVEMGYRSHNTSTCGLHIHVNRDYFGNTYDEQENNIAKVVYFVELHWNELLKFSRRTLETIERWANRYGIESDTRKTYDKAKGNYNRYVAVNLQNNNTIEFRFFRGTLRHQTFIATLQLVNAICNVAMAMSEKCLERLSWSEFVKHITDEELIEYLKVKQLYINESVEIEESEEE